MALHLHFPDSEPLQPDDPIARFVTTAGGHALQAHPLRGDVDVVLTGDEQLRRLNADYRGINRPTDVLSFSMTEGQPLVTGQDTVAGEIYVSVERAREQADALGVDLTEELGRLVVHGLLHLAGYDHDTEETLRFMEAETQRLLDLAGPPASNVSLGEAGQSRSCPPVCPGGQSL